ncbi:MAG: GH25 family lysozyme [Candidatus Limnocylindrales bacterium]
MQGGRGLAGVATVAIALAAVLSIASQPLLVSDGRAARFAPDEASGMTADATYGCQPAPTPRPTPRPTPTPVPTPTPIVELQGEAGLTADHSAPAADRSGLTAFVTGADVPVASDVSDAPPPPGTAGIDISKYQSRVDLQAAAQAGIRFVFVKATQGTTILDEWYARHVRAARGAGLYLGSYHFFDYRKDGTAQADWFVNAMRDAGADMNVLPPVVDVECLSTFGRANQGYARAQLREFADRVYQRTGRLVMVYTSKSMWNRVTGNDRTFGDHPLWVACWFTKEPSVCAPEPLLPAGWTSFDFWQHGPRVIPDPQPDDPDRTRRVDGNVFQGASLAPYKSRPMIVEDGAEETMGGELRLQLRGVDGHQIRTTTRVEGGWGPWRDRASASVVLTGSDGMRTIRVQGRDTRGTTGAIFRDTIRLLPSEPRVTARSLRLTTGTVTTTGSIPMRAEWRIGGTLATVATRTVDVRCDERTVLAITSGVTGPSAAGTDSAAVRARSSERCALEVQVHDAQGAVMDRHAIARSVRLLDDDAGSLRYTDAWRRRAAPGAHDGRTTTSTRSGERVRFTFTGDQVGVLATRGPGRGRIRIRIDGRTVGTIDLRASSTRMRRVVFVRGLQHGEHTIEVLHVKRADGRTGRVDIDGFLFTRP